ncbi:MAG: Fur family transcriptional regulator [Patescibacteria group bacterium]
MKPSWILANLKARGYKSTLPRKKITALIEAHQGIFSAHDIIKRLPGFDKVSVYRTIELLASLDIVHPITTVGGTQFFELHGNTHHHHIICTNCQRSACVDCEVPKVTVRGFTAPHHTFFLTGLCEQCAKREVKT